MNLIYIVSAAALIVLTSIIPPIHFVVSNPFTDKWYILILLAGFFSFYTLFLKVHPFLKAFSILVFIDCFFSVAPLISFTAYVSFVIGVYFYIICTKITDWKPIFRIIQCVLILNLFLLIMQFSHKDSLLNWGTIKTVCHGIIGDRMQMGSLSVILAAALIPFNPLNILFPFLVSGLIVSSWTFLSAAVGLFFPVYYFNSKLALRVLGVTLAVFFIWGFFQGKFKENASDFSGRMGVWKRAIVLSNQHPLTGWGPGTFKEVFPAVSSMQCIPYKTAHNWIIQLIFEIGYPLTLMILIYFSNLAWRLFKARRAACLAGLCMILVNGLVHFPDRMMQTIFIIIAFLAYCEVNLNIRQSLKPNSPHK